MKSTIVEIEPIYQRLKQTPEEMADNSVRLASIDTVLCVTPDDWDVIAWVSDESLENG